VITPDAKDWTWVLERRCPECGFDAAAIEREQVGSMILANAASWQRVLRGTAVAQRPSAAVWSPLEYACHVRDVFRIYDERLARMLTEDDPQYANWDQDATAVADRYGDQQPASVADELVAAAAALANRFDGVAGDQWRRAGTRSDGAHFTVESFARYLIHDPIHHLWDVEGAQP
jgi:DinB superfamily